MTQAEEDVWQSVDDPIITEALHKSAKVLYLNSNLACANVNFDGFMQSAWFLFPITLPF